MTTLSTAAWVAHDLGLASSFGGQLFGRMSMHPAVRSIRSPEERGKVINDAWSNYRRFSSIASGFAAVSWLVGRRMISGRGMGKSIRPLVIVKDVLMGGMVATAIATDITGYALERQAPSGYLPVGETGGPIAQTPPRAAGLVRAVGILGSLNAIFTAGVIGVTAVLAMESGRSVRWSLRSRLLG